MSSKTRVLLISYVAFIIVGMVSGLLDIAWTFMQPDFGVSLDSLGILLLFAMMGSLLITFISGRVIGNRGIFRFLILSGLFAIGGTLAVANSPIWLVLLGSMFVMSIGKSGLDAGMNNVLSARFNTRQMNWLHAMWGVGLTISPLLVTFVVLNLEQSWRLSYVIGCLLMLGLVITIYMTRRYWHLTDDKPKNEPIDIVPATIRETLRQPTALLLTLIFFVYGGVEISTGRLANTLLVESRGVDQAVASSWVSFYWLSFTIGRLLIGVIAIRISSRRLMRWSFALAVLGAGLLWLNLHEAADFLGLAIIGFGIASIFPTLTLQTPARLGLAHSSNAIGIQLGFANLGGAIVPGIAGVLAENINLEMISLVILLTAILSMVLHEVLLHQDVRHQLEVV